MRRAMATAGLNRIRSNSTRPSSRARRSMKCCCADTGSYNMRTLAKIPCLRCTASRCTAHGMTPIQSVKSSNGCAGSSLRARGLSASSQWPHGAGTDRLRAAIAALFLRAARTASECRLAGKVEQGRTAAAKEPDKLTASIHDDLDGSGYAILFVEEPSRIAAFSSLR